MIRTESRDKQRKKIHRRLRRKLAGTAERPRLAVFRSLHHIYAQVIDDDMGRTMAAASSIEKSAADGKGGNIEAAGKIGELIAGRIKELGIQRVVFDRGGYRYHGRVKALAEAARKAGLEF